MIMEQTLAIVAEATKKGKVFADPSGLVDRQQFSARTVNFTKLHGGHLAGQLVLYGM